MLQYLYKISFVNSSYIELKYYRLWKNLIKEIDMYSEWDWTAEPPPELPTYGEEKDSSGRMRPVSKHVTNSCKLGQYPSDQGQVKEKKNGKT